MANITYIANYNESYEQYTCRFFKNPAAAEEWASTYEEFAGEFKFGSSITIEETDQQVVSGTAKYSKGLLIAIMGSPWEYSFAEQFTIKDISREDLLSELKELSFDNEDSKASFTQNGITLSMEALLNDTSTKAKLNGGAEGFGVNSDGLSDHTQRIDNINGKETIVFSFNVAGILNTIDLRYI